MKIDSFSDKQKKVLCWWCESSPYKNWDAIICDGAVRSGKTICMGISFVAWAFYTFNKENFAICSKSINQAKRNVVSVLLPVLEDMGFEFKILNSQNKVIITYKNRENFFYIFGGNDSSSASRIQGITLSGILFDEVALLNKEFVKQALARCSVQNSKFWFNCNPENPGHWFYREWIENAKNKKALYLHFLMQDNPSLTQDIINRYENLYTGTFYNRYVLGEWVASSGVIYPFMSDDMFVDCPSIEKFDKFVVSCDYGTVNPSSFGLWGRLDDCWYRIREYYFASRTEGVSRTDEEHYSGLISLIDGLHIERIVVDPSAASFITVIKQHNKFNVIPAKNEVIDGIRETATALKSKQIYITKNCKSSIKEFSLYRWDSNKKTDTPVKKFDHAMDDIRYFVSTILNDDCQDNFVVFANKR